MGTNVKYLNSSVGMQINDIVTNRKGKENFNVKKVYDG